MIWGDDGRIVMEMLGSPQVCHPIYDLASKNDVENFEGAAWKFQTFWWLHHKDQKPCEGKAKQAFSKRGGWRMLRVATNCYCLWYCSALICTHWT